MVTIVILNYKGWQDTIACLASLQNQTMQDFHVVVADNGSQDESLEQIRHWAQESSFTDRLTLLQFNENYGFAKGNNMAIEAVKDQPADYFWCLNNDTVVVPDCLERLVAYMDTHNEVSVASPAIRLYDRQDTLWNAGGKLVFGGRRYFYAMQPASVLDGIRVLPVTFVTGCALLVRAELIAQTPLFTERFFFGEEDFNFSLRMQSEGHRMVCVTDAVLYHKVGSAQTDIVSYNKLFVYLLNRLIDLRTAYPAWKYRLWISLYLPMIRFKFLRRMSCKEQRQFVQLLRREAAQNDGVSRTLYQHYINYPFVHE